MRIVTLTLLLMVTGCAFDGGYSQDTLYPEDIDTVCLHMFDNRSFRRDVEYSLTDALAKRIESETPLQTPVR